MVNTANNASDEPATTASRIAATGRPFQTRAATTHPTKNGPSTAATTSHVDSDARWWPDVGSPTMITTAKAPASTTAQTHSQRVTRCLVNRA